VFWIDDQADTGNYIAARDLHVFDFITSM